MSAEPVSSYAVLRLQLTVDELLKRTDLAMYDAKRFMVIMSGSSTQICRKLCWRGFAIEAVLRDACKKSVYSVLPDASW